MPNNYVALKGFVGKAPEFGKSTAGVEYATFSLGVSERYYDKDKKEYVNSETDWFNCVAFNALEISVARKIRKGSLVNIEGRVKLHTYKDRDGIERSSLEVVMSSLEEVMIHKSQDTATTYASAIFAN